MKNVLCWSPESTTYELKSEHIKSIFLYLCTHITCSHRLFQRSETSLRTFFFFYNDSQKEEWACGVSAGCLKGSWLYSNCSPCGSEWLPYMCEAVYHKCDMCKDEYMPSKTDQNDEHFWASSSLMVPPSVMSCCRSLLFFLLLFSWGPDHNECNQSSGVIFVQSYYCRCYTEEYSGACVCAFSFLTFDTSPRSISQCFAMSLCGPAGQRKCQSAQCYSG